MRIDGGGMEIRYPLDTIRDFEIFDITADKVHIENVVINSQLDSGEDTDTDLFEKSFATYSHANDSTVGTFPNDTLFLLDGFSEARYNGSGDFEVGEKFHVKIQVEALSGTVNFRFEDNTSVQLVQGDNDFQYTITSAMSPERFKVTASGSATATISRIRVWQIDLLSPVDSVTVNGAASAIKIKPKSTTGGEVVFIENCDISTGETGITVEMNGSGDFKLVSVTDNTFKVRTGAVVRGSHDKISVSNNYFEKERNSVDSDTGVKVVSIAAENSTPTSDVDVNDNTFWGGGDGSNIFISGRDSRTVSLSGNSFISYGYYKDSLGVVKAYETSSGTDPDRENTAGGNFIKLDPVLFNKEQVYLIDNMITSGSCDTCQIFMPVVNAANGVTNVMITDSHFDVADFSGNEPEAPAGGGSGGSESGRFYFNNCKFRIKSSYEQPRFKPEMIINNCVFYSEFATATPDSSGYVRMNEYVDSSFTQPAAPATCTSCEINNSKFYGVGLTIKDDVRLSNVTFEGQTAIKIERDETTPLTDTIRMSFDNVKAPFDLITRTPSNADGSGDLNTFFNLNNCEISFVDSDTKDWMSSLPRLSVSNTFEFDRYIERANDTSQNFVYLDSLDRVPFRVLPPFASSHSTGGTVNTVLATNAAWVDVAQPSDSSLVSFFTHTSPNELTYTGANDEYCSIRAWGNAIITPGIEFEVGFNINGSIDTDHVFSSTGEGNDGVSVHFELLKLLSKDDDIKLQARRVDGGGSSQNLTFSPVFIISKL